MDNTITDTILESMNDGVLVIDFKGRVVFANRAAGDLLHLELYKLAEKSYTELFMSEMENDAFNDILFNGIQKHETRVYCEVPFRRSDGKLIEMAVTTSFLLNKPEGIVVVFKDITESKSLDRARQRVLDHLSHELRTPLMIIKATLKSIATPEKAQLKERMEHNLQRLQDIQLAVDDIVNRKNVVEEVSLGIWIKQVEYLLDIIAEGKIEYAPAVNTIKQEITKLFGKRYSSSQLINLTGEVEKAAENARGAAGRRQIDLCTEISGSSSVWIDPEVLRKTLSAPIKNAIEATPDGGRIVISLIETDAGIIFSVRDTGIGITPGSLSQIFGGFYHACETDLYSTKKPYDFGAGGKGLELLQLKIFSELYQFTIECESRRCIYIPDESMLCTGSIEKCIHVKDAEECANTGGTVFRLKFKKSDGRVA
jgi:two-component system phosphate regulon sensor histidine kinase PhoR